MTGHIGGRTASSTPPSDCRASLSTSAADPPLLFFGFASSVRVPARGRGNQGREALTAETESPPRPGLRDEIGQTRAAVGRLVRAHVDLLRAELGEIVSQLKIIAALGGVLLGIGLFVANLLLIGTFLFLGEWLLGSLGWGVLDGTLLGVGVIIAIALVLMSAPVRLPVTTFLVSAAIGLIVAVVLALNVARRAAEAGATAVRTSVPTLDPAWAPVVVAVAALALVAGVIGLLVGARAGGGRGAVAGLLAGALVGALVGLVLGGLTFSIQGAAALGITTALVLWIALQVRGAVAAKINPAARFERLWPRETYETALETRTWLEKEWAKRRERLANR